MSLRTVVFVDDESNILQGLKRMLHGMRRQWNMHFFESGRAALDFIRDNTVDVLVSDVRMPGMDGVELLKAVREIHPNIIRIILSGHSDYTKALESTRVAHQFLSKPCDAEKLIMTVEQNLLLEDQLHNDNIQKVIGGYDALPSSPVLYQKIMTAIEAEDVNLADIGHLIEQDIAMTAKILQLVNSAFFGLPRSLVKINEALTYLGVDTVKTLVLMQGIFNSLAEKNNEFEQHVDQIWNHSLSTSQLSRDIAKDMGLSPALRDKAFVAGMLHDIGQLILQTHMDEDYQKIRRQAEDAGLPLVEEEFQQLGCNHADIGGFLLTLWGLPTAIVEAVMFHHQPDKKEEDAFSIISAVYFANLIVDNATQELDSNYLQKMADEAAWSRWLSLYADAST